MDEKSEVVRSVEKRFNTTIFGMLSAFEKNFPEALKDKKRWNQMRDEALNKGNKEKRAAVKLLSDGCSIKLRPQTVVWKRMNPSDSKLRLVEIDGKPVKEDEDDRG